MRKAEAYTSSMLMSSPSLARAAVDYRWLLDRGYAHQAALKLVGDRQQLTRDERMILFRGIASSEVSKSRAAIIGREARGRELLVDGYNQALTVMHYLTGRPLFLGSDGLLRDAGGSHGRISQPALFERAVAALVDFIALQEPSILLVCLDAPFPGSAGHAGLIRRLFSAKGIEAELRLERSADGPLKAAPPSSLVATSDGAIADALADSGGGLYDAARWAIDLAFGTAEILDLGRLLAENSASAAR
jgi:hypothetical protein